MKIAAAVVLIGLALLAGTAHAEIPPLSWHLGFYGGSNSTAAADDLHAAYTDMGWDGQSDCGGWGFPCFVVDYPLAWGRSSGAGFLAELGLGPQWRVGVNRPPRWQADVQGLEGQWNSLDRRALGAQVLHEFGPARGWRRRSFAMGAGLALHRYDYRELGNEPGLDSSQSADFSRPALVLLSRAGWVFVRWASLDMTLDARLVPDGEARAQGRSHPVRLHEFNLYFGLALHLPGR